MAYKRVSDRVIWKTELDTDAPDASARIEHLGILSVGLDPKGVPCVWYWAPRKNGLDQESIIVLVGTGRINAVQVNYPFIGTFNYEGFVLHAFEENLVTP